jgi:hypothetical protein
MTIQNTTGYRLPETGGAGTNLFTEIGAFLIFLAFAGTALTFLLPGRRKRDNAKVPDRGGGGGHWPDG